MLYSQDEARKIAEVIRERGDQINKMMYENFDSQIYKRIWKQLCTKMTYIFRNVGQEPEQPLANSESGQLSVGHFKKSVEKHKHNLNELSKAIEESLHSDEEHESSEEVHTSTRTGWGEKIVQFVKSSDRLLGYLTQRTYPQETPETPIPASGACLQKSGADWWTPRICHSCSSGKDSTDWVVILPEAVALSANGGRKYRITAAPGSYECGVTGVRWKSSCEVELEYYWSNWDLVSEVLERDQYHPCGPLLDITVISGRLEAVHLPHFLCLGSEWLLGDAVQVCHVTDEGVSLERCILTRFHATLLHPTFSPKGVLVKNGFRVKAHCKILIYCVLAEPLTLHLYLIPDDSRMEEVSCVMIIKAVEKQESGKCVMISKPNPELSLQMKDWFKLKTMQKTKTSDYDSEITPECLKLRYTTRTPNFFEVYVNNPTEDFYLQMLAKDNNEIVWEVKIRKGDFSQVFRPEGSEWLLGDAVQVCHVTDEGVSLERCILTRFHATLLHPTFSPKGVLVKNGFRVKAHCKILIYRVLAEPLTLHLYLIPDDSRMEELFGLWTNTGQNSLRGFH
ncbi:NACHT, LRR and PYD domains-containing protein 1a allele 5-like [Salminus brasiliensis]|uniref:NACHT, LRR and PYD domains-containing protein 1a allele 5-like n=1 Tax=Salminus brasiliensis TaxID=930266 RepID=UPI003B836E6E